MRRLYPAAIAIALGHCQPGPLGQAVIFVDTDMSVPKLVARLRVDLYTEGGRWFASRDIPAFKASDWPLSFGVHLPENAPSRSVIVRLRAYPEGKTRDYHGERFIDRSLADASSADIRTMPIVLDKRLRDASDNDITPASEPEPMLAIDRLVLLRLQPDRVTSTQILLSGACVGTMADLAGMRTCVESEMQLAAVVETIADAGIPAKGSSRAGSFEAPFKDRPCTVAPRTRHVSSNGQPLYDEEVCVPGGVFIFGAPEVPSGTASDGLPERVAIVPPLLMDKFEVSVGRFRDAISKGFNGGMPFANDGPIATDPTTPYVSPTLCTWTSTPADREDYAVNCLQYRHARAFCEWAGGSLPLEVQWEYAAVMAGRDVRARYPWGDDPEQACDRVSVGRDAIGTCPGFGPARIVPRTVGDISPVGVVDMAGDLFEDTRDAFASRSADCWLGARLLLPTCATKKMTLFALRGGCWAEQGAHGSISHRAVEDLSGASNQVGFRCVRKGTP